MGLLQNIINTFFFYFFFCWQFQNFCGEKEFFYSSIRALESYPFVRKIGEKIGIQPESETDGNSPYFYHLEREKDKFNYLELNYNMETLKSDILEKEKYLSEELNKM